MANPIAFPSTTPKLSLPLLFVGQAQKEPFINHALTMIDALMHGSVTDALASPPSDPFEGEAFRVLAAASGEWSNQEDNIALRVGGSWEFVPPQEGMMVFDQAADKLFRFSAGWQAAIEPTLPSGGTTVDNEAREAISGLIQALRSVGIFANQA